VPLEIVAYPSSHARLSRRSVGHDPPGGGAYPSIRVCSLAIRRGTLTEVPPTDQLPKPGDRFDRYEVLTRLAFGGMAAVYAVRRTSIGGFDKVLAMKVILPHLCATPDAVSMFLDEGRIAAQIEHPNVLNVFDVAEKDDVPFMIMEYVRGKSLANVANDASEPMPLSFIISVLQKAAEGLHAAHEACDLSGQPLNVIHRDVSPQNLMVSYDGDVKVVDFGIAAARGRLATTRSGEIKGKLSYVPPEGIDKSRPIDRRADVWALGVVAWEMLTGRRLFRDNDDATTLWNIMHGDIDSPSKLRDDLPEPLVRCVMKCLERDVDLRTATCGEVASELTSALAVTGGGSRRALSDYLRSMFADEETAERDRLARLMTAAPGAIEELASPTDQQMVARVDEPTDVTAEADISYAHPSKRAPVAAAIGFVVIAGIAITLATNREPVASPDTSPLGAVGSEQAQTESPTATALPNLSQTASSTSRTTTPSSAPRLPDPTSRASTTAVPRRPAPRIVQPAPKPKFDDPY
jgi:hypothetical protein